MTDVLPRVLATILLLVSLAMIAPLGSAVAGVLHGKEVAITALLVPLIFLGTGCALTWLLARKAVSQQLFVTAFALWVVTAAYYFFTLIV
jgi:hypothetical protein